MLDMLAPLAVFLSPFHRNTSKIACSLSKSQRQSRLRVFGPFCLFGLEIVALACPDNATCVRWW